jgi:hypothetical protein
MVGGVAAARDLMLATGGQPWAAKSSGSCARFPEAITWVRQPTTAPDGERRT